jgi:hypothetical protein
VRPADAAQALSYLSGALEFLADADVAEWGAGVQADCLRALAVAESRQAAAHARILTAFAVPGGGLAGDGHRSARVWLTWQTAATRKAAGGEGRLDAHPGRAPGDRQRTGRRGRVGVVRAADRRLDRPAARGGALVAIHRWGWTFTLNADGTTTAVSPDGTKTPEPPATHQGRMTPGVTPRGVRAVQWWPRTMLAPRT